MLRTLIEKELKAILLSPKFTAVFAVCSILILLSIHIGIAEYRASMAHYETVTAQSDQRMRDETRWMNLNTGAIRYPDPMMIFISGLQNDIGRSAPINQRGTIKLYNSNYSENTIFAVFRSMDLMFIVQIVLSLFAILFTYDAINGERETGTLKLSFANPIPRTQYIIAKLIGSWLGLVIPLLIPLLLGIAMVLLYQIPMTGAHWMRLSLSIGLSTLYFTFFICLGVLLSSLTRSSSGSFLYLLVIWVAFVLIIPRAGVMIAGQLKPVPTAAEISSKLTQKSRELFGQLNEWGRERSRSLFEGLQDLPSEEREAQGKKILDEYMGEMREKQEDISRKIAEYDASLNEDLRNRKAEREKLGFSISRFSPASAYQLAAMELAGTGLRLKTSYEDQLRSYSDIFNKFRSKKAAEAGSDAFMLIGPGNNSKPKPLDLSEVPKFKYANMDIAKIMQITLMDFGIISFYILIIIAGTFMAFIRYDVR